MKNSRHVLIQSEVSLKTITTRSQAFSRALRQLRAITLRFHWFNVFSMSFVARVIPFGLVSRHSIAIYSIKITLTRSRRRFVPSPNSPLSLLLDLPQFFSSSSPLIHTVCHESNPCKGSFKHYSVLRKTQQNTCSQGSNQHHSTQRPVHYPTKIAQPLN